MVVSKVTAAIADEKSKVMIPLGLLVACLIGYQIWVFNELQYLRQEIATMGTVTESLKDISDRLKHIEHLMMQESKR